MSDNDNEIWRPLHELQEQVNKAFDDISPDVESFLTNPVLQEGIARAFDGISPDVDSLLADPVDEIYGIFQDTSETRIEPPIEVLPNASASDVAAWMAKMVRSAGELSQGHAVSQIAARFGERFLYTNQNGNPAISHDVLTAFRRITPDVVWAHRERYWRLRNDTDDPRRRRVP